MIADIEDWHHGPSDAMHNPSWPLRISQKISVSFLIEITCISINFLTPNESNTYVLERFNTSAGNPVKKILLKLNPPDHRLPLKMVMEGTYGSS
ncbi:hypothetical protein Tco_0881665 [Tanacetum coccineum]